MQCASVPALCAVVIIVNAYQWIALNFEWPETLESRIRQVPGDNRTTSNPADKRNDEACMLLPIEVVYYACTHSQSQQMPLGATSLVLSALHTPRKLQVTEKPRAHASGRRGACRAGGGLCTPSTDLNVQGALRLPALPLPLHCTRPAQLQRQAEAVPPPPPPLHAAVAGQGPGPAGAVLGQCKAIRRDQIHQTFTDQ
jgi:hypothetical protein